MNQHPDGDAGSGAMIPGNQPDDGRRVLDAEVLGPEDAPGREGMAGASGPGDGRGAGRSGGCRGGAWRQGGAAGGWSSRMGGTFSDRAGAGFGRVWTATGADGNACLVPCVTFALFLVCLSQFGLLAGIGFAVFHLAGAIAGSIRSMRLLMEGRQANPWTWRLGNWFVSFMLTVWLAGGFNG